MLKQEPKHQLSEYNPTDNQEIDLKITFFTLGFITLIAILSDETNTSTFQGVLFFLGLFLLQKIWKKVDKRIEQDGLKMTLRWLVGNVWSIGIVIFSLIALFMFLSWYMGNPILVKTGGTIAGILLALMGVFLAVSMLYALVSIFIEHIQKRGRKD